MKKILIFLCIVMVLFYVNQTKSNFSLKDYFTGKMSYYTQNSVSNTSINLGFCYLSENINKHSIIVGESIVVENLEISTALKILKAKIIEKGYLDNKTTVIYAYSPLITSQIKSKKNKVNLQIAINNNATIIGWPLILGSF